MRKMYCPECGGEIIITREGVSHAYSIEPSGLVCIDNYTGLDGYAEIRFCCINDAEHNIDPRPDSEIIPYDFDDWKDEVEEFFNDNVLPHL